MLRIRNVTKTLGNLALRDLSFDVNEGEYFVLLGASGVGKSVLLEMIAGFIKPDRGRLFLREREITDEKIQRRKVGLVHQDRTLFPHMNVYQNIAYGLRQKALKRSLVRKKVEDIAAELGVTHILNQYPETLSGGESQRVSLARTLATEPLCLLLDEPMSSLDVQACSDIRLLLRRIHRKGRTIVHVTHDFEEAVSLATRIAVMENGGIVQLDTPEEIFRHPKSEFIARFIGIRNFLKGRLAASAGGDRGEAVFYTEGLELSVLTEEENGHGFLMIRSEDIVISNEPSRTSARNCRVGTITDIAPARLGVEVMIDIGVELAALVTKVSLDKLDLKCGKRVWVNFKASAARFFKE